MMFCNNGLVAALMNAECEIRKLELLNENLRGQIDGLRHLLNQRDIEVGAANSACRELMKKVEKLQARDKEREAAHISMTHRLDEEKERNYSLRQEISARPTPPTGGNKIAYPERAKVYESAIKHWGADAQALKAIEELAEVIVEIAKWWNNIGDIEHMAEETADATIMLEQLRLMHDINGKVNAYMDEKIERLQKRIEADK